MIGNPPCSLRVLSLSTGFNFPLDHLPLLLTTLNLRHCSNCQLPLDNLPHSLQELILPKYYHLPIDYLPPHLKTLKNWYFIQKFSILFMFYVLTVVYSTCHGHSLDNLPESLTCLKAIGDTDFNFKDFSLDHLPKGLQSLHLDHVKKY